MAKHGRHHDIARTATENTSFVKDSIRKYGGLRGNPYHAMTIPRSNQQAGHMCAMPVGVGRAVASTLPVTATTHPAFKFIMAGHDTAIDHPDLNTGTAEAAVKDAQPMDTVNLGAVAAFDRGNNGMRGNDRWRPGDLQPGNRLRARSTAASAAT